MIAESEAEVRNNVSGWAEHIREASDLSKEVRRRLVSILSQLIFQKFTNLSNKEISQMLNWLLVARRTERRLDTPPETPPEGENSQASLCPDGQEVIEIWTGDEFII